MEKFKVYLAMMNRETFTQKDLVEYSHVNSSYVEIVVRRAREEGLIELQSDDQFIAKKRGRPVHHYQLTDQAVARMRAEMQSHYAEATRTLDVGANHEALEGFRDGDPPPLLSAAEATIDYLIKGDDLPGGEWNELVKQANRQLRMVDVTLKHTAHKLGPQFRQRVAVLGAQLNRLCDPAFVEQKHQFQGAWSELVRIGTANKYRLVPNRIFPKAVAHVDCIKGTDHLCEMAIATVNSMAVPATSIDIADAHRFQEVYRPLSDVVANPMGMAVNVIITVDRSWSSRRQCRKVFEIGQRQVVTSYVRSVLELAQTNTYESGHDHELFALHGRDSLDTYINQFYLLELSTRLNLPSRRRGTWRLINPPVVLDEQHNAEVSEEIENLGGVYIPNATPEKLYRYLSSVDARRTASLEFVFRNYLAQRGYESSFYLEDGPKSGAEMGGAELADR